MMKKISLIIIMILALIPGKVFGEEVSKGYRGFVDATFDATSYKVAGSYHHTNSGLVLTDVHRQGFVSAGIATSHGYQFNPHLFVGLGLLGSYSQIYNAVLLGTFLHVRTDQTFGHFTPYAEVRTGLKTDSDGAFFITPALGYRFNFGHKTNLNVGVGLNLQYRPNPGSLTYYGHNGDHWKYLVVGKAPVFKPYFDFKIGIDF